MEFDGSGQLLSCYTTSLRIDEIISRQEAGSGEVYYYHSDGLGSVTSLTDATEAVIATYRYDAFGEVYSQTGSVSNSYLFTGREIDSESGLYYYRARYYESEVGRFIAQDPIGFEGGINLYVYVENNPVNYGDPRGEELTACAKCAYYAYKCSKEGLECRKKLCAEKEVVSSSELYQKCFKQIPACQKMLENCAKCGWWPSPKPKPRP